MENIISNTNIPVPKIRKWGLAATKPLGLGPNIVMDIVEGVSAEKILKTQLLSATSD